MSRTPRSACTEPVRRARSAPSVTGRTGRGCGRPASFGEPADGGVDPGHGAVTAEDGERLEQRQSDGAAGDGHPHRSLGLAESHAVLAANRLEALLDLVN